MGKSFSVTNPIPIETFVNYGRAFQARFVPDVEQTHITKIARDGELFCMTTSAGETVLARRVVVAVGIGGLPHLPETLAGLAPTAVSHSSAYGAVTGLVGKRVAVIGSGASAIDVAAVAHEHGADVTIVSSRPKIAFHSAPAPRRLRQKIRRPDTGIGAGWSHWFYVNGPDAFRLLPVDTRTRIVNTALGPAPGWFMRSRIEGHVPVLNNKVPTGAVMQGDKVRLELSGGGETTSFEVDHVVAATGFKVDMRRMPFLDAKLTSTMRLEHGAPVLSSNFETSQPGLYVIGPNAAFSFGPVMRFVYGAGFTTPRVAQHLIRKSGPSRRAAATASVSELAAVR